MKEDFTPSENSMWDLVPKEERQCEQSYVHVMGRFDPSVQIWVRSVCSRPWCDRCESTRLWRMRNRISEYVSHHRDRGDITAVVNWWFLTRSVANSASVGYAFEEFRQAKRTFHRNQLRDEKHPFNRISAWIGVHEMTYNIRTGYNLHQHMLVGSQAHIPRIDYEVLRTKWSTSAGYPAMSHITRMNSVVGSIAYLTKYISKGTWGGLSRGRAYRIREVLKGKNRFTSKRGTSVPKRDRPVYVLCCISRHDNQCVNPNVSEGLLEIEFENNHTTIVEE